MPDALADTLRFRNPPVRSVDLTLYFKPVAELKVSALATLMHEWSEHYTPAGESFALPPVGDTFEASEFFPAGGGFPFPWLMFADEKGHRVGFQNDRFNFYWEFGDGRDYEGFEALAAEMLRRFEIFSDAVRRAAGVAPEVNRAECEYTNEFGTIEPLDVAAVTLLGKALGTDTGIGLERYAFHADLPGSSDEVMQSSARVNAAKRDGENIMWIDASARRIDGNPSPEALLRRAHEALLGAFMRSTTAEQRAAWEPLS